MSWVEIWQTRSLHWRWTLHNRRLERHPHLRQLAKQTTSPTLHGPGNPLSLFLVVCPSLCSTKRIKLLDYYKITKLSICQDTKLKMSVDVREVLIQRCKSCQTWFHLLYSIEKNTSVFMVKGIRHLPYSFERRLWEHALPGWGAHSLSSYQKHELQELHPQLVAFSALSLHE